MWFIWNQPKIMEHLYVIIILIIIILGCYFVLQSFISGDKRRMSYIQVFYNIDTNSIKDLISKCEQFLEKLNKNV